MVAGAVAGIPAGVYRYDVARHELRGGAPGDARRELARAALGQPFVAAAVAVLVFAAVAGRTTRKYGERGARYVQMEAGHAAQNVCLQAAALGLGTVVVGAFDDGGVRAVVGLEAGEEPLALVPVGRR